MFSKIKGGRPASRSGGEPTTPGLRRVLPVRGGAPLLLLLLPLVLTGCQLFDWEGTAESPTTRQEAAGDKVRAIRPRIERLEDLAQLPPGSISPPDAIPSAPAANVYTGRFASGENIFRVLYNNRVSHRDIVGVLRASRSVYRLTRVTAGNWYEITRAGGGLRKLLVQIDPDRQIRVYRSLDGALRARMERISYEVQLVRLNGRMGTQSFLRAVSAAGGSASLAMELSEIFEWVIDFHQDLNSGDRFEALVERRTLRGRPAGFGRILSARFTVGSKTHTAYYFDRGEEVYYTVRGETLRRPFLRSPLKFTRISSRFSQHRFHPILKRYRPHLGVDYAAPTGTPVRAVADGRVSWAGWKGTAGKMVSIQHERGYKTDYLHLSRFAKGVRNGARVRQGKVIGYVGTTGLSTGPHLDFRIARFGKPIDPLSAGFPTGRPVPGAFREEFQEMVRERRAELEQAPPLLSSAGLLAAAPTQPDRKED